VITVDDILALRPCGLWPLERIRAAVGAGKTPTQIARSGESISDRRWVLTQLCARTREGRNTLVLWAAGCAQDVRHLITNEETRDAADCAIQTAVAWAHGGATAEDCQEARRQIWDTPAAAADAAAAYAYAAAAAAADYAAYAAADAAADYAYAAAAYAYAYAAPAADAAAEREKVAEQQLLDLASAMEAL
jgi:hypothetical protein